MSMTRRQILAATAATMGSPLVLRHARGDAPAYRLKATMADLSSHPIYGMLNTWAGDVRNRTNGAVEIKVYGAGQLGSQTNALTAMQTGTIDFVCHTTGFIETIYPAVAVLDLPYVLQTASEAEKVLDGPVGQKLFEQFPAKGIVGLAWGHWGWRPVTHTKKAVPRPEDLAGTKIRVQPGAIYAATYQQLGAPPTVIDVSEIYLALSQGAVDALEVPLISLIAGKFYEVAKHVSQTNFVYNAGAIMASKKTMDRLPPPMRQAITEQTASISPGWRSMMAAKTDEAIAFLKSQGCTIDEVDKAAYAKALQPVWTQFKPIVGADLVAAIQSQTGRA